MMILIYLCSTLSILHGALHGQAYAMSPITRPVQRTTKIVVVGIDDFVACYSCNTSFLQWTYKSRNENYEDIAKGIEIVKNKIHGISELWTNVTINNSECIYNLYLINIHIEAAGLFSYWEGSVELGKTNVIVMTNNISCLATPPPSDSEIILIKQSDSVTIKCYLEYSSDESCVVTAIWTDATGYRNLTIPGDDFQADMDDNQARLEFRPGADIANGTHFNLSFAFNCSSFSNNSLDDRQQGRYDFGRVPFIIVYEENIISNISETREENNIDFILALISGIPVVSVVATVVLLLVCLKRFSKLCFANSLQTKRNKDSALSKDLPEIPMVEGYIEIRHEILRKETIQIGRYEALDDGTYEAINDEESNRTYNLISE